MNKKLNPFILFAFIMLLALSGQAIIGNSQDLDTAPKMPSVCRMIQRSSTGTLSICTAFLVAPNRAVTAAHCVSSETDWAKEITYLECGQSGINKDQSKIELSGVGTPIMTQGVSFEETHRVTAHVSSDKTDQALLVLATSSSFKPLEVMKAAPEELKQCWIGGYGLNNKNYAGSLISSKIQGPDVDVANRLFVSDSYFKSPVHLDLEFIDFKDNLLGMARTRDLVSNFVDGQATNSRFGPGDSGGPLICEKKNGEVGVIGISSQVYFLRMLEKTSPATVDWMQRSYFAVIDFKNIGKPEPRDTQNCIVEARCEADRKIPVRVGVESSRSAYDKIDAVPNAARLMLTYNKDGKRSRHEEKFYVTFSPRFKSYFFDSSLIRDGIARNRKHYQETMGLCQQQLQKYRDMPRCAP